jgi:hypothetical protein
MKKNTSRLSVFCAVILGFMLAGYDVGFAHTQSLNLVAAHFVPAAEMPINVAVTLKEQTPSTWQSAFEWVFLPAIVLGSLLLIVWVLAFSAASMLPALPQVGAATAQKQAALYDTGDRVKSSHPAPAKGPGIGDRFSIPFPRHHPHHHAA